MLTTSHRPSFLAVVFIILSSQFSFLLLIAKIAIARPPGTSEQAKPNVILVMADDQGWGQTSYNHHPILKTPNLDAMAANGLRFDRFYAAAPVCSPTRAAVLTGRTNQRTGVESHGYALRLQEKTIAQAMQNAGYATGHFGKWHLNGMRGPGVPIFANDSHSPGVFGFQTWLSVTNFFDRDPTMSRAGNFEEFAGDSSEIIVDEAIKFIRLNASNHKPFFTVIWFGTPHQPFMAATEDAQPFAHLDKNSQEQLGELVAMDRSIGTLRNSLVDSGIADNTILWFSSDNGGLPKLSPNTTGGLRGFKGSVYEGGLRVPAIVEWPGKIKPRVTNFPAVSMDIFPTIAEIVELPESAMLAPIDGISLRKLFEGEIGSRTTAIPFAYQGRIAIIDNNIKLVSTGGKKQETAFELFDLAVDPKEEHNLFESDVDLAKTMQQKMEAYENSIAASIAGNDYPSGQLNADENPTPRSWTDVPAYQPYFEVWQDRPEYKSWLKPKLK